MVERMARVAGDLAVAREERLKVKDPPEPNEFGIALLWRLGQWGEAPQQARVELSVDLLAEG
jgi:hypothetical protein